MRRLRGRFVSPSPAVAALQVRLVIAANAVAIYAFISRAH